MSDKLTRKQLLKLFQYYWKIEEICNDKQVKIPKFGEELKQIEYKLMYILMNGIRDGELK